MSKSFDYKLIILTLSLLLSWQTASATGINTVLKGLAGDDQRLSDYLGKGKWVLFNIWGPKCPPCLEEVSELTAFQDAHQGRDAEVVSLALDFPSFGYAKADEVAAFVDDYFINFPVMLGNAELSREVTGKRLRGTPTSYLYAPGGELVAIRVGTVTQTLIEQFIEKYQTEKIQ